MEAIKQNNVLPISLEEEMERSYLDYAMSVIVSRALPDVRDGMKPVHRRILFGMFESSCLPTKPHKKSARIVGEVMGKYHPHGDTAIYDSLVRMAQDFSLRLPLVDGQGNFGSMDGDAPAAMRYTESRLSKASLSLLESIYESTVDFRPNYDGSEEEPCVLPAQFPNLLVNGANGIAVGMATNIPPHNLGEVIDACCAYVDNNNITFEEIAEFVKGPDFPTGGMIMGHAGIRSAICTGRGSIIMRGKAEIETRADNRQSIVITEIPYQVNKAKLVERIAELVNEKKIEGIASDGLRDESNKSGVRVVIDLKKDIIADVILNQLYSYTPLQTSFGVNMLALDNGVPKLMNIKNVIVAFVNFREEVITRRTKHRLLKARERAHILIGLATAVANIDEMIEMIKSSSDPVVAKEKLMSKAWDISSILPMVLLVEGENYLMLDDKNIKLSEDQAKAILEMRLQRLTGLEHQKINDELNSIILDIKEFMHILSSRDYMLDILKNELIEVKNMFATPRKTEIQIGEFEQDIEDLIPREEMVVIVTMGGYVKRVPLSTYRSQKRGGKGRSAMNINEEDATIDLFVASTHSPILFFSNFGKVYRLKTYKLPFGTPQSKGRAFVNLLPLQAGETITNVTILPEDKEDWKGKQIIFCTQSGSIRRNDISDFENINAGGKIAMKLDEGDMLVGVALCSDNDHIMLAAKSGKAVRCPIEAVRVFKGRNSVGVRGIKLSNDDNVISMSILTGTASEIEKRDIFLSIPLEIRRDIAKAEDISELYNNLDDQIKSILTTEEVKQFADKEQFILTVTENGYGKRSSAYEYRVTNRGGQGIINIVTSERNGNVISSLPIEENDHLMMLTNKGKIIRCPVKDIRISGRNTQGVKLFNTNPGESVVSAVRIVGAEDFEDDGQGVNIEEPNNDNG